MSNTIKFLTSLLKTWNCRL
uniref:Uncharacterized protein n=1 Tax=Anguilla anguilla TaxID=7936 RepID=A0A0E9V5E8_ANGAN